MHQPIKTLVAAKQLKVLYTKLISLLRYGKLVHPQKDTSGDFMWEKHDLDAARRALEALKKKAKR